jgi:hypothetical protein
MIGFLPSLPQQKPAHARVRREIGLGLRAVVRQPFSVLEKLQ